MSRDPWLVEVGAPGTEVAAVLYVIPHAGAGVAAVKDMCRALSDRCAAVAVRLPGRESRTREKPLTSVDLIADALAPRIDRHAGPRRVYLYGHCSGAVLAYAVARRLTGRRVGHLIVSAHHSPDRTPVRGAWRTPTDQFLAQVAVDGYVPDAVLHDREMHEFVVPALRADYEAIETHRPAKVAIDVPILGLLGTEEHAVPEDDFVAWREFTSLGFELVRLPGGHNLLRDRPDDVVTAVASTLT